MRFVVNVASAITGHTTKKISVLSNGNEQEAHPPCNNSTAAALSNTLLIAVSLSSFIRCYVVCVRCDRSVSVSVVSVEE